MLAKNYSKKLFVPAFKKIQTGNLGVKNSMRPKQFFILAVPMLTKHVSASQEEVIIFLTF